MLVWDFTTHFIHFVKNSSALKLATSSAPRRFDCGDVDLFHGHHRVERALGGSGIGVSDRLGQVDRRDLPG